MDSLISFTTSPAILPWFILCAVVIFERFWYLPTRLDPMTFVRLVASRMAERVCPKPFVNAKLSTQKTPTSQFWISGALAAFMIIIPNLIILLIFREFVYYPALFDAVILYLCIQFSSNIQRFQHIRRALLANKKKLAKNLLAPMVLRETSMLSDLGVSKGAIESLLLRFHYQALVCYFLFIVFGPITTLAYRLCYELHQVWNTKIDLYSEFGKPMAKLVAVFQWLPIRFNAFLTVILSKGFKAISYLKTHQISKRWNEAHGAILLRANHFGLNINLSGAVFYNKVKVRRAKYIGNGEPTAQFMPNALAVINRVLIVNLMLLLLTCLIINRLNMYL
jgi:adenosylcobinamide-phosphate synthase